MKPMQHCTTTAATAGCLLVVIACGNARSERAETGDAAAQFATLSQDWLTRYNDGDARAVANLYTTDGYYVSAHVLAHGREEIERYWARGIAAGGHVDAILPLETRVEGNLGYLVGRYQATNAGTAVDGRILIVGRRVSGQWYIAAHHTVVRDQPE